MQGGRRKMTNIEKFKEVFGFVPSIEKESCVGAPIMCDVVSSCRECPFRNWWDREFKECFKMDESILQALRKKEFRKDAEGWLIYTHPKMNWTGRFRNGELILENEIGGKLMKFNDFEMRSFMDLKEIVDNFVDTFEKLKARTEE